VVSQAAYEARKRKKEIYSVKLLLRGPGGGGMRKNEHYGGLSNRGPKRENVTWARLSKRASAEGRVQRPLSLTGRRGKEETGIAGKRL